jgi:hypothetical protein
MYAAILCPHGYAVYTAVTCTDVATVCERYEVGDVDLVVFASVVHGWHDQEEERRPAGTPQASDAEWQVRNLRAVIDTVCKRQASPTRVLIAAELMTFGWYKITAEALEAAGVEYQTYSASHPDAIVDILRGERPL